MGRIAIVDGVRTPFVKAWTHFWDIPAQRLGAIVVRELMEMTRLKPELIDEVIFGAVAQPVEASNVSRVISLYAGIPKEKRAYTLSRNCASGLEAITSASEKIGAGMDEVVIAGGAESMSNMPFVLGKEMAKALVMLGKAKTAIEKLKIISKIRLSHLKPIPGLALGLTDPVCGLNMGQTAEVIAKEFGIPREEQDAFALMSHQRAFANRMKLREEIVPVPIPPEYNIVIEDDNGPRENQTMEALGGLRPYFDRHTGTVTVGNSCQVTDGACALLVMDEEKACAMGYEPLGYIRAYHYIGLEPHKMGLGPAYAIPAVLKKASLSLKDIDLVEINEAFACQVLSCCRALGDIPLEKLNVNGGAIALGHTVGVSGARLVLTALKEMKRRNAKLGLISM